MKAPVSLTSFRPQKSLAIAIGVLAVVVLPFLSYYTVNEGERGILLRYGKIVKVAEPGLGFKIPFMESVEKISTRNQAVVYQGLQAYSRDQQYQSASTLNLQKQARFIPPTTPLKH